MGRMGSFGTRLVWIVIYRQDVVEPPPQTSIPLVTCSCPKQFPFSSMEEDQQKELQLLPAPHNISSSSHIPRWPSESSSPSMKYRSSKDHHRHPYEVPSLDLQLSTFRPPPSSLISDSGCIEALKWQAAEQIRLAALEKAYAERVRELTRREMEMAQSEFSRARHMWEKAREEVDRAEKLKERATRRINPTCMEVTCQACRQKFRS